jgi:hypothetical protein
MTVSWASVVNFLRNAGSLASLVIGAANVGGLPVAVRTGLVTAGGVLQVVEHWATISGASTTSTPAAKPPPST